jgi:hypothetical protein
MRTATPGGYPSIRPYLHIDDAARAIEFYVKAFGAEERMRLAVPGGKIAHAELEIGDSLIMLCDPLPQFEPRPPTQLGGTSAEVFGGCDDQVGDRRSILGRSLRRDHRPVRPHVVDRDADRGSDAGGGRRASQGGDEFELIRGA